jgi:hypothetical protein
MLDRSVQKTPRITLNADTHSHFASMNSRGLAGLSFIVCTLLHFTVSTSAVAADFTKIAPVIQEHCLQCHNDDVREGGLNLGSLSNDLTNNTNRDQWVHLFDRVAKREMPPQGSAMPDQDRETLLTSLDPLLYEADLNDVIANGRGPMRRLNRDEFENNLRDLLLLPDLSIRDILPEDRTAHHFNKTTAMLDMSRVQLMAYLNAAETALIEATASGIDAPPSLPFRALATQMFAEAETFGNKEAMFYAKDGQMIPISGGRLAEIRRMNEHDPSVEMALFRSAHWPYYGYPHGFLATRPGRYQVRFSARSVLQFPGYSLKPGTDSVAMTFRARKPSGPDVSGDVRATGGVMDITPEAATYETTILLKTGETFEYSLLGLPVPLARNVNNGPPEYRYPPLPQTGQPGVAFQWIEVDGPVISEAWPPASHKILFDSLPIAAVPSGSFPPIDVIVDQPREDAQRLLRRFIQRCSHRPLSEDDILPFEELVLTRLSYGDRFVEAMLAGYKAFLCSSHFLYLQEPRSVGDDFAVASRLSHFLTNSRPDSQLLTHAEKHELRTAEHLAAETDRLISSPQFERFVRSFSDYWLDLRHLYRDEPDVRLYPEYRFDSYLIESMEQETRAFLTAMIRDNLSIECLIDTDFVLVNDRLAAHYGLPPVSGSTVRKTSIDDASPLGGLLTQAAILKVTANGTSTSPVVRGAWMMDRLLGDPPPKPPASVPAVEPDIRGASTVRELLALHTKSESCAACHARFDPVGLALENFDVLGGWRTRYRSLGPGDAVQGIDRAGHDFSYSLAADVDATGQLLDGRRFTNVNDLRTLLLQNPRQLARNLLNQLVVYSTGTPVRFSDRKEIELILDRCAPQEYQVRDLIHGLVQSRIFLGDSP